MKPVVLLLFLLCILKVNAQPKLLVGLPNTTVHLYFDSLLQLYGYPGDSVEQTIDEKGNLKLHIDIDIARADSIHFNGLSAFFGNNGRNRECIMQITLANSDYLSYTLEAMNNNWNMVSKNHWVLNKMPTGDKPVKAEYKDYGGAYFAMIFTREE